MTHNRYMSNYDAYLEAPYQAAYALGDAFERWCEANDLDPEEALMEDFEQAMIDAAEDRAIESAELSRENDDFDRY